MLCINKRLYWRNWSYRCGRCNWRQCDWADRAHRSYRPNRAYWRNWSYRCGRCNWRQCDWADRAHRSYRPNWTHWE